MTFRVRKALPIAPVWSAVSMTPLSRSEAMLPILVGMADRRKAEASALQAGVIIDD